jgi:hypothetical protein
MISFFWIHYAAFSVILIFLDIANTDFPLHYNRSHLAITKILKVHATVSITFFLKQKIEVN